MREFPTNDLIRERMGKNHPIPLGWKAIVETYTTGKHFKSADGSDSEFLRADMAIERDQYHSCIGQILMMGDACFKGEKFKDWKLIPTIGDYIFVKKYRTELHTWINPETKETIHYQEIEELLLGSIVPNPSQVLNHNFLGK